MLLTSIIMPAYNVEKYISASIESVMAQTNEHWELIIVNDGATDNTLQLIKDYMAKDERIRVISQINQGVSAARNRGLFQIKGDYIAFLNATDSYDPRYLELLIGNLEKNDADLVFCKSKRRKEDRILRKSPKAMTLKNGSFAEHLLSVQPDAYTATSFLYKRAHIAKYDLRFTVGCHFGEDFEFALKMASVGKVSFMPEYLYYDLSYPNSDFDNGVTYQNIEDELASLNRVIEFIHEECRSNDKNNYLKQINRRINCTKDKFKDRLWDDICQGSLDRAMEQLEAYNEPLTLESGNIVQRFINAKKLRVINAKDRSLWKKYVQ